MKSVSRREAMKAGAALGVSSLAPSIAFAAQDDWAADLQILRQALDIHPGTLRYLNPAALEAAIDLLSQEMRTSQALADKYLALSRFLAKIKCGHTYANFFNQSRKVKQELFNRTTRLPFTFRWLNEQMVVTSSADGVDLPRGSVITSINGVEPTQMLAELLPYTRADGKAQQKRIALLEVQHRSRFEYFDVFHGLIYAAPKNGMHALTLQTPQGRTINASEPALDLAGRMTMREAALGQVESGAPLWTFEVKDGVGVLTMPTWSTFNTPWNWQEWLDAQLDRASDLKGLIIDNRANEGGNPEVGERLLSRLIDNPAAVPIMRRLVRFRSFPQSLRAHAGTWDQSYYTIGEQAKPVARGFYELPLEQQTTVITPRGKTVDAPVALLTSPTNSSASFTFASIMKAVGRGTLIGQPTGGNRRGINGDGFFFTTLPKCGIEFDLPMVGKFPVTPQPDEGLVPDITIEETAQTIAAGCDPAMDQAFSMFEK